MDPQEQLRLQAQAEAEAEIELEQEQAQAQPTSFSNAFANNLTAAASSIPFVNQGAALVRSALPGYGSYDQELQALRQGERSWAEQHPNQAMASSVIGTLATAPALPSIKTAQGAGLFARMLAAGGTGAGYGGVQALSDGGDSSDIARSMILGGVLGAPFGAIGGSASNEARAAKDIRKLLKDVPKDKVDDLANLLKSESKIIKDRGMSSAEALSGKPGAAPLASLQATMQRAEPFSTKYAERNVQQTEDLAKLLLGKESNKLPGNFRTQARAIADRELEGLLPSKKANSMIAEVLDKERNDPVLTQYLHIKSGEMRGLHQDIKAFTRKFYNQTGRLVPDELKEAPKILENKIKTGKDITVDELYGVRRLLNKSYETRTHAEQKSLDKIRDAIDTRLPQDLVSATKLRGKEFLMQEAQDAMRDHGGNFSIKQFNKFVAENEARLAKNPESHQKIMQAARAQAADHIVNMKTNSTDDFIATAYSWFRNNERGLEKIYEGDRGKYQALRTVMETLKRRAAISQTKITGSQGGSPTAQFLSSSMSGIPMLGHALKAIKGISDRGKEELLWRGLFEEPKLMARLLNKSLDKKESYQLTRKIIAIGAGKFGASVYKPKESELEPYIDEPKSEAQDTVEAALKPQGLSYGGVDIDRMARAVAAVESTNNPRAVSKKNARGLFQFLPDTAAELGIDPFSPKEARQGFNTYYTQLLKKYGSAEKALAAYNFGMGNIDKGRSYPRETRNYIASVMKRYNKES